VESLFIETVDGERFKLPFTKLTGGRAMLEHVRQGGRPYDVRGCHIGEIVKEMAVLSRFNRASQQRVFEGVTQELVETAVNYYHSLQENLKRLATGRGYNSYFETWTPADINEQSALVEDLRTLFVEQTLDARIEAALPTLAKLQQQGNAMKEVQVFENWINQLSEGTWALPETPEQNAKLKELMSKELIVGPDGTNATEQLYDVIGDDELFDRINDLAERDPRANLWDDTDVQQRLQELGIQMPSDNEGGDDEDYYALPMPDGDRDEQPPIAKQQFAPQAGVKEGGPYDLPGKDYDRPGDVKRKQPSGEHNPYPYSKEEDDDYFREIFRKKREAKDQGMAEGLGYSQDPAQAKWYHEGRKAFKGGTTGNLIQDIAKKHGVPSEWIDAFRAGYQDQEGFSKDGMAEGGYEHPPMPDDYYGKDNKEPMGSDDNYDDEMAEGDNMSTFEQAECNHTMEGEYCPEHGLAECGNYGMYESELARIKSLALFK
jgi:hypothetical protein